MKTKEAGLTTCRVSDDGKRVALTFQLESGKSTTVTVPTDCLGRIKQGLNVAEWEAVAKSDPSTLQQSFHCIRTWAVGVHPEQDAVLLVFDAETPNRSHYAITAVAARDLGASLTKRSSEKLGHGAADGLISA